MNLVYINPNPSGAYPPIQTGNFSAVPEGMAVWPEGVPTEVFYEYSGFVSLTIETQENIPTVTECTPNLTAWEAWRASLPPEPNPLDGAKESALQTLSEACSAAIIAGCDVTLSDGSGGHISLTAEDQINLSTALTTVEQGAAGYPYHLDGQLCTVYPAADIQAMAVAATAHKLYHTTYYNHLAAWVRRCESVEEVESITYGSELPDDLAANMAAVLAAAGGNADV